MTAVRFTWDEDKNRINQRKHDGISFEVAAQVFRDPFRLSRQDRFEGGETRWQTIGVVRGVTLLLVAHTLSDDGDVEVIRLISARRALPKERGRYERENS